MAELDIARLVAGGLFRGAHRIAGDAAAHILEADLARHQRLAALDAAGEDELAQHLVLDQRQKLVEALVLVMVAVDVDDQDVVEAALDRLLAGVGEEPAGVELFERHPPTAIGKKVHGVLLRQYRTLLGVATMAAPPVWPSASQTGGSVHQ